MPSASVLAWLRDVHPSCSPSFSTVLLHVVFGFLLYVFLLVVVAYGYLFSLVYSLLFLNSNHHESFQYFKLLRTSLPILSRQFPYPILTTPQLYCPCQLIFHFSFALLLSWFLFWLLVPSVFQLAVRTGWHFSSWISTGFVGCSRFNVSSKCWFHLSSTSFCSVIGWTSFLQTAGLLLLIVLHMVLLMPNSALICPLLLASLVSGISPFIHLRLSFHSCLFISLSSRIRRITSS